jgi:hypothetical protein
MIGIPIAWAYANAGEWFIHKYVLHGLGKNRKSFWAFHWHDHHNKARRHDMLDDQYTRSLLNWEPQTKELVALGALAVTHLPLLPIAPFFTSTLLYCAARYYVMHRRAHLDPDWAKEHLPWHWDHHMGRDQNQNWCVTNPWFDHVMGTRKEYLRERQEREAAAVARQVREAPMDAAANDGEPAAMPATAAAT